MKKIFTVLVLILGLSLNISAVVLADWINPSASEEVQHFEGNYKPQYNKMNEDLQNAFILAREWHSDAQLYSFNVPLRETDAPTYNFMFISNSDTSKSYLVGNVADEYGGPVHLEGNDFERTAEMKYAITEKFPMRLRHAVAALRNDPQILSTIDKQGGLFTTLSFDLHKNEKNQLMWFIVLGGYENEKTVSYSITVPVDKIIHPAFSEPVKKVYNF